MCRSELRLLRLAQQNETIIAQNEIIIDLLNVDADDRLWVGQRKAEIMRASGYAQADEGGRWLLDDCDD